MSHFIFCDQMLFEPLNSSHLDQSDDLSRLPDYLDILKTLKEERDVEWYEADEVHNVQSSDSFSGPGVTHSASLVNVSQDLTMSALTIFQFGFVQI